MTLKEKIIHESLRQFSTNGYMGTSISDILEAVGTSKGGLPGGATKDYGKGGNSADLR